MTLILLKAGLIILPYYETLMRGCPLAIVQAPDTRVAKAFLGIWVALAIGLTSLYAGEIRGCKNKWLILFLIFIPLNIHLSPKYNIEINGIDSTNYWVWKPFVMILCYFLMFMAVQSLNITRKSLRSIFSVVMWCGFIMGGYVLLQNAGWDQFFSKRLGDQFLAVTKPVTVGTLGNSTIVSPYIAMIVPFALYFNRYIISTVLILAVIATQSAMAIGAMVVSVILYSCLRWRVKASIAVLAVIIISASLLINVKTTNPSQYANIMSNITNTNGRIPVWKETIRIIKEEEIGNKIKSRYPFTGVGLGSYPILIRPLIKTMFSKAHNEYLEILCTLGIIGLILFLLSIGYMMKSAFYAYIDDFNRLELITLMSSFVCIALIAGGTFVWQIAPTIFYTIIIVGLLHNRRILNGELE